MTILPPNEVGLTAAAAALRAGEVVAYPTETVYGLAVNPFDSAALRRLFEVKGRPEENPVLLVVADEGQLAQVVREVSTAAQTCIDAFWPGPLSLLLPKAVDLPVEVTAGQAKVCVRCPASEIARALCRQFGGAITSTSANRSGEKPAATIEGAMLPGVALGIDGGRLPESLPSTLLDPESGRILRAGAVPEADILACLRAQGPGM
ncbi:MAG: L-threonylcarbamoyladenylate synthase [FCB group bacterium]|nr:L-threonylcarbamoyladenylate synthase [FCB group bacterium]